MCKTGFLRSLLLLRRCHCFTVLVCLLSLLDPPPPSYIHGEKTLALELPHTRTRTLFVERERERGRPLRAPLINCRHFFVFFFPSARTAGCGEQNSDPGGHTAWIPGFRDPLSRTDSCFFSTPPANWFLSRLPCAGSPPPLSGADYTPLII